MGQLAHTDVRYLPDNAVDDVSEVGAINDNFRYLNTGKLDLKPGSIIPREDSRFDLGAVGSEWASLYVDTATVTAKLVAGTATYGCVSFYGTTCTNDNLDIGRDAIIGNSGNARAEIGGGGYAHVGSYTNHDFRIRSNNTDRIWVDNTGRVGIGAAPNVSFSPKLTLFDGNSDDTLYRPLRLDAGGNDAATNLESYTTISVSSVAATTIIQVSNYGGLCVVAGDNNVVFFADLLLASYGGNPVKISTAQFVGAAPARTYTNNGAGLTQLQMAAGSAGTYQVHSFCLDVESR